ncbi:MULTISPECIES: SNF2-related protein [Aeromonas]|uniref:SNF2-related protein n=1 Tax=Aeromonas TaxID=642 RepID=UPI001396BE9C|nr:SNF2-related protein [Aeromonas veronii]
MAGQFAAGARVRLVSDPGRIGTIGDKSRARGDVYYHLVHFSDGSSWIDEPNLESVDSGSNDVFSLLERGHFGRAHDLRRNLTHIQLSGRLANLIYSMDTTNTEFYAYQYKPVMAFLESPAKGLLIADEVGLGKTIEAGLIWTELRARWDARRLMIVCPAMLCEKWQTELAERFGIEATIMNAAELLTELRQRPRSHYPQGRAIICSYSGLRPPRDSSDNQGPRKQLATLLQEHAGEEPLFDMVIFDEAHNLRNAQSATSRLGHALRDTSDNLILLSATPINLHSQDLYQLLRIIDEDTFKNENIFPQIMNANAHLVKAREMTLNRSVDWQAILAELKMARSHRFLEHNQQLAKLCKLTFTDATFADEGHRIDLANKIERCNLLSRVITRTRKAEVKELRVVREPKVLCVDMTDTERHLYQEVTQLVRAYAVELDMNEGFLQATPLRQLSSCTYAAVNRWRKLTSGRGLDVDNVGHEIYEDFGSDKNIEVHSISPLMGRIMSGLASKVDMKEIWVNDSKFKQLEQLITTYLQDKPEEKIIIFSYFRETLNYLSQRLDALDFKSQVLMGGMRETKQTIIDRFREQRELRILLASEVASEGVDLQFCRVLINYDLPWNPMRIEQRIGRIDRHGQRAEKISIFNLCHNETIDERIYSRLYDRLEIFTHSLGNMEAILGDKIQRLTHELLSTQLTPEQEQERIEQTSMALARLRQEHEELEANASNLIAHGGHILQEVNAAHEFSKRITDYDLMLYVKDYLERYTQGARFLQHSSDNLLFDIELPSQEAAQLQDFVKKHRLSSQTKLNSGASVTCSFLNNVAKKSSDTEVINQSHPLIRYISDKLHSKQEVNIRLISIALPLAKANGMSEDIYVGVLKRSSFHGARIEERLIARAYGLQQADLIAPDQAMDLINLARLHGYDWPEVRYECNVETIADIIWRCDDALKQDYELDVLQKKAENHDRIELQVASSRGHLERLVDSLRQVISKHQQVGGRESLVKANQGKIYKLEQRFEVNLASLEQQKELKHRIDDVAYLVINVCKD